MRIRLPEQFIYTNRAHNSSAYVKDGILYVSGYVNFEELMYTATYVLKGYDKCHYCGAELTEKNRSLDHMYPRRWGGVSITDNLIPSCKDCNQEKKDMTYDQFMRYKQCKSQQEKDEFYLKCLEENLKTRKRAKFTIDRDWLTVYDIREVLKYMKFNKLERNKSRKLAAYYRNWGQYTHPVIISSNDWVFKGRHILHHAKSARRHSVIAIVLENVIVVKDTS